MSALLALDPGPLATVQDLGRFGYQRFGVSPAGAMDAVALRVANLLVGNPPDAAAIEFTLGGGTWRVEAESCRLAVAGGAFPLGIDGRPATAWRSHTLARGARIGIAGAPDAARGYLAVAGGFALEPVLGSLSTHLRSGIGGRAIRAGDALPLALAQAPAGNDLALDRADLPARRQPIRVILGPQDDYFEPAAIETFLAGDYTLTHESDRMGYRLAGPPIEHRLGADIVSDGIVTGSIQVPGSRRPILLLADRQTAGGYPKIATVIGADLSAAGQLRPGDGIRFAAVTLAVALEARRKQEAWLSTLPRRLRPVAADLAADRLLALNLIDGVVDARGRESAD